MELLSFRQTAGPFGDETSEYVVTVNKKDATIGDLIDYVLNERDFIIRNDTTKHGADSGLA